MGGPHHTVCSPEYCLICLDRHLPCVLPSDIYSKRWAFCPCCHQLAVCRCYSCCCCCCCCQQTCYVRIGFLAVSSVENSVTFGSVSRSPLASGWPDPLPVQALDYKRR